MSYLITEPAIDVDRPNGIFKTSASFRPGTVVASCNGQLLPTWKISEGPGNQFTVDPPPKSDDGVEVQYEPVL